MDSPSHTSYLVAARELLIATGQSHPNCSAQIQAALQEAIENIEDAHEGLQESNE